MVQTLIDNPRYGLTIKDAKTLVGLDTGDRLDYYFDVVEILNQQTTPEEQASMKLGKAAGNWYVQASITTWNILLKIPGCSWNSVAS